MKRDGIFSCSFSAMFFSFFSLIFVLLGAAVCTVCTGAGGGVMGSTGALGSGVSVSSTTAFRSCSGFAGGA